MEQQLKERLVGAVVLVCAAVIVIPIMLSGKVEETPAPAQAPAKAPAARPKAAAAAPGFSSRVVPLQPQDAPVSPRRETSRPPAPPAPAPRAPPPRPAAASRPPAPAPSPTPPAAPSPARPDAAVPEGEWVVQLGSFSSTRNARALRDRLRGGGYPAFMESTTHGATEVTRVYVGPQRSREQAQAMVARLLEETRLKGIVLRNPAR